MEIEAVRASSYETSKKFSLARHGEIGKVVRIVDGNTLYIAFLRNNEFVRVPCRLRRVNAPHKDPTAKSVLEEITFDKIVRVERPSTDKFGRLLCNLRLDEDERLVNDIVLERHPEFLYRAKLKENIVEAEEGEYNVV